MRTSESYSARWLAVAILAWTIAGVSWTTLRLNFERAPAIHVRWARTVDDRIRARLEQRFALSDGEREAERTWVYFLTSSSTGNIRDLIQHPGVEDTHHIDRLNFLVSPSAERRGPFVGNGPRWVPKALEFLTIAGSVAGAVALGIGIGPAARRTLVGTSSRDAIIRSLRSSSTWALLVMSAALVLVWIRYVTHLRAGAEESLPFRVGDWLVSYEVGFVRRGLPGSLILNATTLLSVPPERVVLWIQVILYTLLSLLLFLIARRKRLNLWFLAFIFSPAGLLFPLYDPAVVGRKDVLFFVALALYAWWMPSPVRRWPSVVTFALGAVATLSHELFFFFTPYFVVMRFLQTEGNAPRRFRHELWLFAGSLAALLLVSTIGADMNGEAQCAVLLSRGFNEQLCDGIMRYPVTTIRESIQYVDGAIRHLGYLIVYPIASVLAVLPLIPLFASTRSLRRRLTPACILAVLAAVAFTIPMVAIALDWGRLLNIHVMAMSVLLMRFMLDDRQTAGSFFGTASTWLRVASVLLVAVYLTGWSIRHCCDHPFRPGLFE